MAQLVTGAVDVQRDEPAFALVEVNLQPPDSSGWRRYQIIYVIRNDRLAEYREDLGPRANFTAEAFRIPGGVWDADTRRIEIVHSVAELKDIAENVRLGPIVAPEIQPRDIIGEHDLLQEQKRQLMKELGK